MIGGGGIELEATELNVNLCFRHIMAPKQPNTGLFVGLNKGHIVTKKELAPRPSDRKGVCSFSFFVISMILSD